MYPGYAPPPGGGGGGAFVRQWPSEAPPGGPAPARFPAPLPGWPPAASGLPRPPGGLAPGRGGGGQMGGGQMGGGLRGPMPLAPPYVPGLGGGWEPGREGPGPRDGGACAVFWDLAGCRPAGPDSGRCAKRSIAALYGRIDVARAYGDRASVHGGVRAGLQNSGVQLVDTGAHSNDRSPILIDMFDYALGRPAPATVVLLLGGLPRERFGLALRRLAERGYRVVLVRPADSPATAFDGACHASHDWAQIRPSDEADVVAMCFKCGWRNCRRVHPRRCAATVCCAKCGQTSHDTRYHAEFQQYVSRRASDGAAKAPAPRAAPDYAGAYDGTAYDYQEAYESGAYDGAGTRRLGANARAFAPTPGVAALTAALDAAGPRPADAAPPEAAVADMVRGLDLAGLDAPPAGAPRLDYARGGADEEDSTEIMRAIAALSPLEEDPSPAGSTLLVPSAV